jgi:hypothetical protein
MLRRVWLVSFGRCVCCICLLANVSDVGACVCLVYSLCAYIYWESIGGDEVSPKVLSIAFRA